MTDFLRGQDRELERQQRLLRAIRAPSDQTDLRGWVTDPLQGRGGAAGKAPRGLLAYAANAAALAERALAANYPTVQALIGEDAFAGLARAVWHRKPPSRGDLAWFSEALPEFLSHEAQLVDLPYLSDVARLDWALARAELAADVQPEPSSFEALARQDPGELFAVLAPGVDLLESAWPIVSVWEAHHRPASVADPFALVREAIEARRAQSGWVWRAGWRVQVGEVVPEDLKFLRALLRRASLAEALDQAGEGFDFSACLQRGLQQGWWLGVSSL
jgi:hypothetical protein